jgi:hypothetical protein
MAAVMSKLQVLAKVMDNDVPVYMCVSIGIIGSRTSVGVPLRQPRLAGYIVCIQGTP